MTNPTVEGRSVPARHAAGEFCFFCVPDEVALAGIASYDRREPYEGPTVHWQVPESFCPHFVEAGDES